MASSSIFKSFHLRHYPAKFDILSKSYGGIPLYSFRAVRISEESNKRPDQYDVFTRARPH